MHNSEEIKVSVFCTCYNHENYIRDCLDGFIMQETNFKFEVLVHDDASTDNSANIIKEYEMKYPDIIKPIYQTVNQYSQDIDIASDILLPKAKGKYIAFCEGDDFWSDIHKLQTQYNILENNVNCNICLHKVKAINYLRKKDKLFYPSYNIMEGFIDNDKFLEYRCLKHQFFHVSSYFVTKKSFVEYYSLRNKYFNLPQCGDLSMQIFYGYYGGIYYIDKVMSCYRKNVPNSWSARHSILQNDNLINIETSLRSLNTFNIFTKDKYKKYILGQIEVMKYEQARCYLYKVLTENNKWSKYKEYKEHVDRLSYKEKLVTILAVKAPFLYNGISKIRSILIK